MKEVLVVIIIFITVLFSEAQWVQLGQDIDGDISYRSLGASVCISGDGAVVATGAPGYSENEPYGLVRVFTNQSGNWVQIGNDIIGEYEYDRFGTSISISSDGNIIAIGAPFNNENGENSGSVRVYQNQSNNWIQIGGDIDGDTIGDKFGNSISMSSDGSIIAIGAYANDESFNGAGQVKIFANQSGNWVQIGSDICGVEEGAVLGTSLSLSSDGSIVAIGVPGYDGDSLNIGCTRIFRYELSNWAQIGDDIKGEFEDDWFGTGVSLNSDGTVLAVSTPYSYVSTGYVKVYNNELGVWTQIGNKISGQIARGGFGYSISIDSTGRTLVVGSTSCFDGFCDVGYVNVYNNISNTWLLVNDTINREYSNDNFGVVDINSDGSIVIVGASGNDENGYSSGHARVFKNSSVSVPVLEKSEACNLYPNPTTGKVTIQSDNIQKVEVYNISGKLIKSTTSNVINIDEQAKGVYFVKLIGESGVSTQKIILE